MSMKYAKKHVLVRSVDTDVFVLLTYYYSEIPHINGKELFIELGHASTRRIISVSKVVQSLGKKLSQCLLPLHALTGCDTTSAFFKIGKKTAFDIARKNVDVFKELSKIHDSSAADVTKISTECALLLFRNKNSKIKCLNELRYVETMTTNKSASQLPPTDDSFTQHVLR